MQTINRSAARVSFLVLAFLGIAGVHAHVASAQTSVPIDTTNRPTLKPSADLITHEQVSSRTFPNAYAAIEALHSNWLRARNLNPPTGSVINPPTATDKSTGASPTMQPMPREATGIKVYIDGVRAGNIEALKSIPINTVYSIRRINGTAAQARFGIGHSDGVIYVATGPDKDIHN